MGEDKMKIARFREQDGKKQELKEHIENVSILAENFGEKIGLRHTLKLIGLAHDMGKFGSEFQDYINKQWEKRTERGISKKNSGIDHAVYGAKYIYNLARELGVRRLFAEIIAYVCCYHHGGLPDCENIKLGRKRALEERISKIDDEQLAKVVKTFKEEVKIDLSQLLKDSAKELECVFQLMQYNMDLEVQRFNISILTKSIYSMLIDADRLDSMCFEEERKISEFLEKCDMSIWERYNEKFEDYMKQLRSIKPLTEQEIKINLIRKEISDECFQSAQGKTGIYRLTVPTGGGKTLSSMRFAMEHNKRNRKQRIVYVIPYTSIIEQNADVIRRVLGNECDLLEHHSNVIYDEDDELGKDGKEQYKFLVERWDNDIVFTTMVQFLNTFFGKGTHDGRRLHNLINATIIFDEIQTLPIKCMYMFNSAIQFLNQICNSTIVLCTATQPNLEKVKIPIAEDIKIKEMVTGVEEKFLKLKRVELRRHLEIKSLDQVLDFITRKKAEVKSLLVVVNKVISAKRIFEQLQCNMACEKTQIVYLSSALCPEHRRNQLVYIKKLLKEKKDIICISTPVIEAGVDISFDAAIRNLTKLDSIIQTAGRVNRNGENKVGYCDVINYDEGSYSKLKEIEYGRKNSRRILENNKDIFADINTVTDYFSYYYNEKEIKENFRYKIEKSVMKQYSEKYLYTMLQNKLESQLTIKFKSASENFYVIDKNSVSVLVPYKTRGRELSMEIQNLTEFDAVKRKRKLLKEARKYCINLYFYQFKNLVEKGAVIDKKLTKNKEMGIYILGDGFYDEENLGVLDEEMIESFII